MELDALDCSPQDPQKTLIKTEGENTEDMTKKLIDKVVKTWNDRLKQLWDMTKSKRLGSVGTPVVRIKVNCWLSTELEKT